MKGIISILLTSVTCLFIGVGIAYYNTASFGYDNAVLFSSEKDKIIIMDIEIYYEDIISFADKAVDNMPDKFITI